MDSEEAVLDAVDAVYVCTWTSEHPRLVAAAVERGLPVFCEKPLATTLDGARGRWPTAVAAAGVVNQVGLVLRSSPAFLELKHQIEDPRSGRVQAAVLRDDQFLPVQGMYGSTWRADPEQGRGRARCSSTRSTTSTRSSGCSARSVSVSARSSTFHGNPGIEDTVVVGMELAGGAQVSLTSVWHQLLERPSLRRLEVICEHAFFTLEHDVMGPVTWTRPGEQGSLEGGELFSAVAERHDGRSPNQDAGFVEAVASGDARPPPRLRAPRCGPTWSSTAIYRSRRRGARRSTSARPDDALSPGADHAGESADRLPGRRGRGAAAGAGRRARRRGPSRAPRPRPSDAARGPSTSRLYGAS